MGAETRDQPELSCQWCGGTIPEGGNACRDCGALRPREDLVVPGLSQEAQSPVLTPDQAEPDSREDEDAERARQILKDMDAYIPENTPPSQTRRDPGDDLIVVLVVLGAGGLIGGLLGWLLLPPFLHQFFESVVGVESDGPEAFRRLGAFVGALLCMLFGAVLTTFLRR